MRQVTRGTARHLRDAVMVTMAHLETEPDISLADFTRPDLVVPRLRPGDAAAVIRELCTVLQGAACVPALLPFYHAALNREFLFTTAREHGFAFPHARVSGLSRLSFALGRSAEPLVWVPKGGPLVRLVFLCAVPATDARAYLWLTSGLARLAKEPRALEQLLEAGGASEMFEALEQIKLGPAARTAPRSAISGLRLPEGGPLH